MNPLALTAWFWAVLAVPAFAGPGIPVDVPVTSPTPARAAGTQRHPLAATDGRDFFAVWIDSRGGFASLYGTRILAGGTVLDPAGILISAPEQYCDSFALAWDGSNYVVAWQADSRVNFARVDRDGVVLGPPQIVFDRNGSQPLIASNGHGTVVIVHALLLQSNVLVSQNLTALISQNGVVTQEAAMQELGSNVQIASNGDGYLLSWADLSVSSTALLRLDSNGNPVAGSAQLLPEAAYTQLTAATGGQYLLVRRKVSGGASCAQSIVGRLVTSSGLSDPFLIHDSGGANIQDVAVTADGNGFEVVWMRRAGTIECPSGFSDPGPPPSPPFDLEEVHVGLDGRSGTPSTMTAGLGSHEQPAVASNGGTQAVVWIDIDAAHRTAKIAGAIGDQGAQAAPLRIASSAPAQSEPAIAAGEGLFMTAWSEERPIDGTSAVYARRFDTEGHALDAAATQVSTNDQTRAFSPAVSFDGTVWLFVWSEDSKVVARRMALDGSWIDATPMILGPAGTANYAVASNGDGFAVLILTGNSALTLIPRAGSTRQVLVPLNLGFTEFLMNPSMAWDGTGYTAVWTHGNTNDIEGIRLDQDVRIITPRFDIARTSRTEWTPSIACRAAECIVAWYSDGSIAVSRLINGVPVGVPGHGIIPPAAGGYAFQPRVLATRDGFLLLWTEWNGVMHSLLTASISQSGIGDPVVLGSIAISAAAITSRDQLALTIARPAYDSANGGAVRAFLRFWPVGRRRAIKP